MIWDSSPWKHDIALRADALRRRKDQKRWSEASMVRVEQDIFLSAFAVRKLIESLKMSDEGESRSIRTKGYKRRSGAADIINWQRIDQLYEVDVVIKVLSAVDEDDIVSMSMMRADVAMPMKITGKSSRYESRT